MGDLRSKNMAAVPATIPHQPPSLLTKLAERYSVDPNKMLGTLKATAFKGDVSNEQMMALLIVADQYNLNPWTKEVYAFPDKNNGIVPVVGLDGWSRIINSHPMFDGMEFEDGPAGQQGLPEWIECVIFRKDRAHAVRTREYMAECKRTTGPWGSHPRRMLRHKATIQCARLAFGFVGIYDQDEAERMREARDITPRSPQAVETINARIAAASTVAEDAKSPAPTFAAIEEMLRNAGDRDSLAAAAAAAQSVADPEQRDELLAMLEVRRSEMVNAD